MKPLKSIQNVFFYSVCGPQSTLFPHSVAMPATMNEWEINFIESNQCPCQLVDKYSRVWSAFSVLVDASRSSHFHLFCDPPQRPTNRANKVLLISIRRDIFSHRFSSRHRRLYRMLGCLPIWKCDEKS